MSWTGLLSRKETKKSAKRTYAPADIRPVIKAHLITVLFIGCHDFYWLLHFILESLMQVLHSCGKSYAWWRVKQVV